MRHDTLYLDHAATTPLRPEARDAMAPFLAERYGNPSSGHAAGRAARSALEEARERVAAAIGARRAEVVFTAGGTEADNLAVLGRWRSSGGPVVLSAIEHSAVREAAAQAAREGAAVVTLAVDEAGLVDRGALIEALRESPSVVSVLWGNNEVGTIQPVDEIGALCRERGVVFHTDAVQAVGHVPVRVDGFGCDLLSMSAHKIGGPQGVGALYVREGVELEPVLHGGGQERGLRAGTSNVAGAVGLAAALASAASSLAEEVDRLAALRDRLESELRRSVPDLVVNGDSAPRLPHVLSVGLTGLPPDLLMASLDLEGLAVSSGSACHSGGSAPSHVLLAMGRGDQAVARFSLGWTTTPDEVERAAAIFERVVDRVRATAGGGVA